MQRRKFLVLMGGTALATLVPVGVGELDPQWEWGRQIETFAFDTSYIPMVSETRTNVILHSERFQSQTRGEVRWPTDTQAPATDAEKKCRPARASLKRPADHRLERG